MKKLWFLVAFLLTLGIANVSFAAQYAPLSSKYGVELLAKKINEQLVAKSQHNIRIVACNKFYVNQLGETTYELIFNETVAGKVAVFAKSTPDGYVDSISYLMLTSVDDTKVVDQFGDIFLASLRVLETSDFETDTLLGQAKKEAEKNTEKNETFGFVWNEKNKRYYVLIFNKKAKAFTLRAAIE